MIFAFWNEKVGCHKRTNFGETPNYIKWGWSYKPMGRDGA